MKNKFASKPITVGLCIYIIGFILFTVFNYVLETRSMTREIDVKLENGARAISLLVGAENMQQLLRGEVDEEQYIDLVRTLSDYADMMGFGYLYVLQDNGREVVNVVTSATPEEWQEQDFQMNGDVFTGAMEFMLRAMQTGEIWHDELADEWGHFRSIYVPFKGPDGHPYILAADMDISVIRSMQRRSLFNSFFTGLLFLLFATPLILLTARDMREQRNKLAREVEDQTAHISVLNADLQKQLEEVAEKAALSRSALEQAEQAKAEAEQARREGSIAAANKIERAVTDISSTLHALAQKIVEAEHGAATQANMITDTSHQMELINSSITDVARNAQNASDLSRQASGQADNSAATARSAVASMLQVNKETGELRDNMSALGAHSQAIVQIMSIISDIADQTNLLALNAAIEAARAGDAGRGFAVVADEVRKLAERTMVSTGEVGKVVEAVRQGSQRSLEQTEVAIQAVANAEKLVDESGSSLNHIRQVMEQAAGEVQSIAVAANQQSSSSASISQAMREINSISDRTSSLMSEADSALNKLSAQADILAKVVEDLKKG